MSFTSCRRVVHRWVLGIAAVVAFLCVLCASGTAQAQQRTFYLDRLQIGAEPKDGIAVWRPRMSEKTIFFGQFGVGYALLPLRGSTVSVNDRVAGTTPAPVKNQLNTYFSGGLELMQRVALVVTVPVTAYQNGGNPCDRLGAACDNTDINPTVPGDTRFDLRVVLHRSDSQKFHLGAAGSLWIPSGDNISFTSDKETQGGFQLLSELDFRSLQLAFSTGIHFRYESVINRLNVGNEWTWGAGAFVPLRDGAVRLGAELFGSTGLGQAGGNDTFFTKRNTPLEWLGEVKIAMGKERQAWFGAGAGTRLTPGYGGPGLRVVATLGYSFSLSDSEPTSPSRRFRAERMEEPNYADRDKDGFPDDIDTCPDKPEDGAEPEPRDGCPAASDRDHDGIADDADKCPDQAEDLDSIEDFDGCPEEDFDQDSIADGQDACPREPGQASSEADKNGCPQFIRRVEGSTEIQILKRVEFATNSAVILPISFPILDEVVSLLKANGDIKRMSVEGHTDNRGSRPLNTSLSQGRSESVMKYLVQHGIDAARLEAHGFGPDKPVDTNDTNDGRQKNRRVEFHVLQAQ